MPSCKTCAHYRNETPSLVTDSPEAQELSRKYGADVIKTFSDARSAELDAAALESGTLTKLLKDGESSWPVRPRYTPFCGANIADGSYPIPSLKNADGSCKDHLLRGGRFSCNDCKHRKPPTPDPGRTLAAREIERLKDEAELAEIRAKEARDEAFASGRLNIRYGMTVMPNADFTAGIYNRAAGSRALARQLREQSAGLEFEAEREEGMRKAQELREVAVRGRLSSEPTAFARCSGEQGYVPCLLVNPDGRCHRRLRQVLEEKSEALALAVELRAWSGGKAEPSSQRKLTEGDRLKPRDRDPTD